MFYYSSLASITNRVINIQKMIYCNWNKRNVPLRYMPLFDNKILKTK